MPVDLLGGEHFTFGCVIQPPLPIILRIGTNVSHASLIFSGLPRHTCTPSTSSSCGAVVAWLEIVKTPTTWREADLFSPIAVAAFIARKILFIFMYDLRPESISN